jgi:hypothetical protein
MHIFNRGESGKHPHRVDMCACNPAVEYVNEGEGYEGYIIVHRCLDEIREAHAAPL